MTKIKYIGPKDELPDFPSGSGLNWTPNLAIDVKNEVAAALLVYADSFTTEGEVEAEVIKQPEKKKDDDEDIFANVNVLAMTKPVLVQYAHRTFGVALDANLKKDVLVDKVNQLIKGARIVE